MRQIKYLCNIIPDVEWSGVLFYSVEGSIKDFSTLKITVEHVFPMHKGSKGYTEYDYTEDIVDYRMNNMEALKWKIGHIHSHNTFGVFFSGTDLSELNDNSPFHNYYLSLIVNNNMDMTAKIAFIGEVPSYSCKDEKGDPYNFELAEPEQVMFTYDCTIEQQGEVLKVDSGFRERVDYIMEEAKKKPVFTQKPELGPATGRGWSRTEKRVEDYKKSPDKFFEKNNKSDDFDTDNYDYSRDQTELTSNNILNEDFARYILRLGDNTLEKDTLESAIADVDASDIKFFEYTNDILGKYADMFDTYWRGTMEMDMENFVTTTEEVIDLLSDYPQDFMEHITSGLQLMLNRLEITSTIKK